MQILPSRIPSPELKLPELKLPHALGRRRKADVVGLDIQPGFVAAVRAHVNGAITAERVATLALPADTVRDGEVTDEDTLAEVLRELFAGSGLGKRVRVGVANQRTVLRTLELPPVTDNKELAAAVNFQAQDQVPMPLSNAVMDFQALGIVETPAGPRQRVALVAAQKDMVERLLAGVRRAGLTVEGIDLSAFALIRSLHRPASDQDGRVLYLNVDGLTNLAIAEGKICLFTRVVGSGLEGMAGELAERRGVPLADARALLAEVDLREQAPAAQASAPAEAQPEPQDTDVAGDLAAHPESAEEAAERERSMSFEELATVPAPAAEQPHGTGTGASVGADAEAWSILDNGIRDISGEVRNSLDFHRSQEGGGEVAHIVLSGAARDIPGFQDALQRSLGVDVRGEDIHITDERFAGTGSPSRLAVAAGLATFEAPQ